MLHRLLSRRTRLYTEMVTAEAVIRGDRTRLLGFDAREHPVALQLGGSEPARLAEAARIGAGFGYDEINLNVGCPSDRVQSGRFGACLMAEPDLVGDCIASMRAAVALPVTIKCRLGIDDQDPEQALRELVQTGKQAGAKVFIIHARKAWLKGLSPKENREVPPLDYGLVHAIKVENPELTIVLNGGLTRLEDAQMQLAHVDGVMFGRAAYQNPELLAAVDASFFGEPQTDLDEALEQWCHYVASQLCTGVPLQAMTRHMLGLFAGRPGARLFRRQLSERAPRPGASIEVLRTALAFVHSPHRTAA